MKVSLSDLLQSLRIAKVDAAFVELGATAGVRFATSGYAFIHLVLDGDVLFDSDEQTGGVTLCPGDYAVFLDRRAHISRSVAGAAATTTEYFTVAHSHDAPPTIRFGAGRRGARLLSGAFHLPSINPLIRALPARMFVHKSAEGEPKGVNVDFDSLANAAAGPGATTLLTSAFDFLLVQAVRQESVKLLPEGLELAGTVQHLRIPIALSLIRAHPERRWTLAGLAEEVGISRSTFAAEFASVVGQPLMQYLTDLRMARARDMLRWQPVAVSDVAWHAGYESIASFTRAFRKYYKTTPAAYQQSQAPQYADAVAGHMHWAPFMPVNPRND
jgi:AraC-like DNA-binding protein